MKMRGTEKEKERKKKPRQKEKKREREKGTSMLVMVVSKSQRMMMTTISRVSDLRPEKKTSCAACCLVQLDTTYTTTSTVD
jgi:hypothetical protein